MTFYCIGDQINAAFFKINKIKFWKKIQTLNFSMEVYFRNVYKVVEKPHKINSSLNLYSL